MNDRIKAALRAAALQYGGACIAAYLVWCRVHGVCEADRRTECDYLLQVGGRAAGKRQAKWWWAYSERPQDDAERATAAAPAAQNVRDGCDLTLPLPGDSDKGGAE